MIKTFNKEYFITHRGCYSLNKMQSLIDNNPYSTIEEFLQWNIPLKDKLFFLFNYTELSIKEQQYLALLCAKTVLPIFEEQYPDDKRVRECIEETELFLKGESTEEKMLAKRKAAADAAYAAAYAAYAAIYAAFYAAIYAYSAASAVKGEYVLILLNNIIQWCKEQK